MILLHMKTAQKRKKKLSIKHLENKSCRSTPLWPDRSTELYTTCYAANSQVQVTMNHCSRRSWILKKQWLIEYQKTQSSIFYHQNYSHWDQTNKPSDYLNHYCSGCSFIISLNPRVCIIYTKNWVNLAPL